MALIKVEITAESHEDLIQQVAKLAVSLGIGQPKESILEAKVEAESTAENRTTSESELAAVAGP